MGKDLKDIILQEPTARPASGDDFTRFLSLNESSVYTSHTKSALRRAVRNGELQVFRIGSRLMKFRRAWLDQWLDACRTRGVASRRRPPIGARVQLMGVRVPCTVVAHLDWKGYAHCLRFAGLSDQRWRGDGDGSPSGGVGL